MGNVQNKSNKKLNFSKGPFKSTNEESSFKRRLMSPKEFFSKIFRIKTKKEDNKELPDTSDIIQNINNIQNNINKQKCNSFENNHTDSVQEEEENEEESENTEEIEDNNEESDKFYITNSIKTVFIDSKRNNKNIKMNKESSDSLISTTFDYELNFYHNEDTLRGSYISKLITKKIWNPELKPKKHNSVIIFDWDDTLLPTSYLVSDNNELSKTEIEKMKEIEKKVGSILEESIEKGNTYIITNAGINWVEYTVNKFYRNITNLFNKIKIISARKEYENIFPGDIRQWKIEAFLNILKDVDNKKITNIVCIGDSLFEVEAGRILASKFAQSFIKTVKFKETPKLDELLKQLKLVYEKFNSIYSSIQNLTIRIEKKKDQI